MTRDDLVELTREILTQTLEKLKNREALDNGFYMLDEAEKNMSWQPFRSLAHLLNSGNGKSMLFALCRIWVEQSKASAAFFITETWQFVGNEKSKTLDHEQFDAKVDKGFKRLIKEGYGKAYQAIMVQGMTPNFATLATRLFEDFDLNGQRKLVFFGEVEEKECETAKFKGRLKMFGPFTERSVEEYYNKFKAAPELLEFFNKNDPAESVEKN